MIVHPNSIKMYPKPLLKPIQEGLSVESIGSRESFRRALLQLLLQLDLDVDLALKRGVGNNGT